jgi:hypothetical protein
VGPRLGAGLRAALDGRLQALFGELTGAAAEGDAGGGLAAGDRQDVADDHRHVEEEPAVVPQLGEEAAVLLLL